MLADDDPSLLQKVSNKQCAFKTDESESDLRKIRRRFIGAVRMSSTPAQSSTCSGSNPGPSAPCRCKESALIAQMASVKMVAEVEQIA